jgi:16S rRNA (adenine1518-N6/adenine1519-N6)-dimethyltransferase
VPQRPGAPVSSKERLPPLREVIAKHGLMAKKSLGQNFLLDLNLTGRIARAAGALADRPVLEIGPGPGGLTRALLAQGAEVIAIERDPRFLPALAEIQAAYPGKLTIVEGDALELDEAALVARIGRGPMPVVANLPYNVATPLVVKWLEFEPWPPWFDSLTLMFQREVADRLAATVDTSAYGRLSVLAQWRSRVKRLFDVPAQAFVPPPKITSAIIRIEPLAQARAEATRSDLSRVLGAAFGQRRKMLRQSLRALGLPPEVLLAHAGIDPTARAETIDINGFAALARAYGELSRTHARVEPPAD